MLASGNDGEIDMIKLFRVLGIWTGKTVVLLILSAISFNTFVLGNDRVPAAMAAVFVGLILTISSFTAEMAASKLGIKLKNENYKKLLLFAEAVIIIWFAKLFSLITGFGIANNFVVLVISAIVVYIDDPLLKRIEKIKLEN